MSMEFILLKTVKMLHVTIVGILTFISRITAISVCLSRNVSLFFSILAFDQLTGHAYGVEHGKSNIVSSQFIKVKRKAKIRNRYNQVPYLTRDKNTQTHHTNKSQEASPFQAGGHKPARDRHDSILRTNVYHKCQKGSTKEAQPWNDLKVLDVLNMCNNTDLSKKRAKIRNRYD